MAEEAGVAAFPQRGAQIKMGEGSVEVGAVQEEWAKVACKMTWREHSAERRQGRHEQSKNFSAGQRRPLKGFPVGEESSNLHVKQPWSSIRETATL